MTDLLEQITSLIDASNDDLDQIENTLTDGYAHALALEAEQWRLGRQISEAAQTIEDGDMPAKAQELSTLARRRDATARDLVKLRSLLAGLRRHADDVRIAAPSSR